MTTITIVETGVVPSALQPAFGTYPAMFERALGAGREDLRFRTVDARACVYPATAALDAVLITGSPAGVYEDLPWIAPLEAFVRAVHAAGVPLVGVCFGHQLIAQALGGTVEKSPRGWGLGRHVYALAPGSLFLSRPAVALACSHQDQVVRPPADADVLLSSAFTPYAGLLYRHGTTMSVQAHPEFAPAYAVALCHLRAGQVSAAAVDTAVDSLRLPLDREAVNDAIGRFLAGPPPGDAT